MTRVWLVLLGVSVAGLFYIYLGYPLLVALRARLRPRPVRKAPFTGSCSVLIVAHNEAARLPAKLADLRRAANAERVAEIVIASDGSTDDSAAVVRAAGDPRVRWLAFPERRGKPAVLNDALPACQGEIVVLMDARQRLEPGALEALLENFADPAVGAVSGELVFRAEGADTAAARGLSAYWSYEKSIRRAESRCGSVPGATGALYAVRKALFRPIPPDALLDDVAIPMQIVRQGYRCVFEERARVVDRPSATPAQEAVRKRRTIAGNAQFLRLFPEWFCPRSNPIWWSFVSHKMLRLLSPLLLLGLLAASAGLAARPWGAALLALQLAAGLLAAAGGLAQRIGRRGGPASAAFVFLHLNFITLLALGDALRGRYAPRWRRAYDTEPDA